MAATYLSKLQ